MEIHHYALCRGNDIAINLSNIFQNTVFWAFFKTQFGIVSEQSVFNKILVALLQYYYHDTERSGVTPSQEYSFYFVM